MTRPEILTLDVHPLLPSHHEPVIFTIVDRLGEIGAPQALLVVTDHKLVGLPMEIEMRKQTEGQYNFSSEQQEDGVWLARIEGKGRSG